MANINRVTITGNLTKDPELKALSSGTSVCSLRVAVNGRRRNPSTQQWEEVPNYFDVTVWGAQGENCKRFLSKGRAIAVDGRLQWREWGEEGAKRQAVDIVADTVQFLGGREDGAGGNGNGFQSSVRATESDVPIDTGDFERTPVSAGADDDIPF
jgi:single-strand DNA-binding protein